jgi:3-oxoacyl-[acyl-carrier protein] reductase
MSARRFVVTGCASGIGRHLADALLRRGESVLATDIELDALERAAAELGWPQERTRLQRLDVCDPDAWQAALETGVAVFGGLDVLLNVAGYLYPAWLHETPAEEVHRQLDINTKGVVFGTQTAARHMLARGSGHIVNIASLAALAPVPGLALYCASKYAVRAFSLAAAQELRPRGVAVTVVCPDAVQTPMLDRQLGRDEAALTFSGPRLLTVQDVERVVLGRVLQRRPLEVFLPASRGWLARFADVFPATTALLEPVLRRKGLRHQAALRGR